MKKFIFSIIAFVVIALVSGAYWNLNRHKECAFENYQKELANRGAKIKLLEDSILKQKDSILKLETRVDLYQELTDWFRQDDSAKFEKAIHQLWNVREE